MRSRSIHRALVAAILAVFVVIDAAAAAPVAVTREQQRDVMLTVYNMNLGLVKDVREVRLPTGVNSVEFKDVAAQIDPTTVSIKSLANGQAVKVLEQNYEYDLLSSQKLMEKYLGKIVRLYQSDGTYHDARLLATDGPVFEINGQIHLGYIGRMVLPSLPENLVSRPTLVWLLRNTLEAPQRVEASYLTTGISWRADYVMVVNAADDRGDLTGWVTIDNKSGSTYTNAALKLVAGDVNRAPDARQARAMLDAAAKSAPASPAHEFAAESLFEYHLYTLDARTTVKDRQTKQISLLAARDVPITKQLIYYGAQDYYRTQYGMPMSNQKVGVYFEVTNSAAKGLGMPLPRGKVRVYKADAGGSQQLIGEDWIDHTPKDERITVKMGNAFDVVGERTQREFRRIASNIYEVEWEIALRNHKSADQTVSVIEPVPGDWQVLTASQAWQKPEAHTLRFEVRVPKHGAAKITYRVRTRF